MSGMEPQDFLTVFAEVLPEGMRPQVKAKWIAICGALGLPTDVGVAEMIEFDACL